MDFPSTGKSSSSSSSQRQHQQQQQAHNSSSHLDDDDDDCTASSTNNVGNHSTATASSTSTTPSHDKKPRAKATTTAVGSHRESAAAAAAAARTTEEHHHDDYDRYHSGRSMVAVGTNPFMAATLSERDEHFPSFDQAFLNITSSGDTGSQKNRYIGDVGTSTGSCAVNLSISALAALSEHNRYVARYGIDNSLIQDQGDENDDNDDDDETFPQSLFADPLDIEWERLLLNTSDTNHSATNVSHISLNHSLQSLPERHLLSDDKIRIITTRSPDGLETDAIEVMTEVSYSDVLNTSRMIKLLRTPEHVKKQQERAENAVSSFENDNNGTATIRRSSAPREVRSSSNHTSEASFSDDSLRKLQQLYSHAMLPPMIQHQLQPMMMNDSLSMASTPSRTSKSMTDDHNNNNSGGGGHQNVPTTTAATSSFSLHNVDLSRISADDDDDDDDDDNGAIIRSLDHSFGTAASGANNILFPCPILDHVDDSGGIHYLLPNDQTPSTSNHKNRKTITKKEHFGGEHTDPWPTPSEQNRWQRDSSKPSSMMISPNAVLTLDDMDDNQSAISSPSRDPQHVSVVAERSFRVHDDHQHHHFQEDKNENDDTDSIENQFEMMGLSPISRQAADRAVSLLRSSPDWNTTKGVVVVREERRSSNPNPFGAEPPLPDFFPSFNDASTESHLSQHHLFHFVEYEQNSGSTVSDNPLRLLSNEDVVSQLHSSSEPNNTTEENSNNSGVMHNTSGIAAVMDHPIHTNMLENSVTGSSSSDDRLKKNSLSSISPNSSSEHHITTKPTTTTNSSSSFSASSNNPKNSSTSIPAQPPGNLSVSNNNKSKQQPVSVDASNTQYSLPRWDDQNDRRRYRTVVPIRVFMNEPFHFPNEDDSFGTTPHHAKGYSSGLSVSSLPVTSTRIRHQNHDRSERSSRSDPW